MYFSPAKAQLIEHIDDIKAILNDSNKSTDVLRETKVTFYRVGKANKMCSNGSYRNDIRHFVNHAEINLREIRRRS